MKKMFRKIIAGALAGMLALTTCAPAYAAGGSLTAADIAAAIHALNIREDKALRDNVTAPNADMRMPEVDASALPAKLDLRDVDGKNYVSPVKDQSPWGTCWSFGGIAAAETSIAYDSGHDYSSETDEIEAKLFDLSEKHLAWFSYTPLPPDNEKYPSQGGEGYHVVVPEDASPNTISEKTYNVGGLYNYATTMFSAGIGPALEAGVPYQKTTEEEYKMLTLVVAEISEDGHYNMDTTTMEKYDPSKITADELIEKWTSLGFEEMDPTTASLLYAGSVFFEDGIPDYDGGAMKVFAVFEGDGNGDWTLDEDLRFMTAYLLKDGNLLPSPALTGENGEYIFNQVGVGAGFAKSDSCVEKAASVSIPAIAMISFASEEASDPMHSSVQLQQRKRIKFAALAIVYPASLDRIQNAVPYYKYSLRGGKQITGSPSRPRLAVDQRRICDTHKIPSIVLYEFTKFCGQFSISHNYSCYNESSGSAANKVGILYRMPILI